MKGKLDHAEDWAEDKIDERRTGSTGTADRRRR